MSDNEILIITTVVRTLAIYTALFLIVFYRKEIANLWRSLPRVDLSTRSMMRMNRRREKMLINLELINRTCKEMGVTNSSSTVEKFQKLYEDVSGVNLKAFYDSAKLLSERCTRFEDENRKFKLEQEAIAARRKRNIEAWNRRPVEPDHNIDDVILRMKLKKKRKISPHLPAASEDLSEEGAEFLI